ncbi:hypothetical protein [Methylophilus luteus]|uniref:DUF262 domain-containing protein n=1 Tax=Methylophilus luteus TaxID=640108 RepID=A0ABW3F3F9_9PROT
MEIKSKIFDGRVECDNYLVEMSNSEYLEFAIAALENNEYQRRRVSGSKSVYALLKEDLKTGCVLPALVLALPVEMDGDLANTMSKHKGKILILDGLQRTNTMIDLKNELERSEEDQGVLQEFLSRRIRCEIYVNLNRVGVLYRMLTLNTGQTPMSIRQQLEMLYLDYAKTNKTGLILVSEKADRPIENIDEYNFREVIEAFNSYLERDELPFDRVDILENIKSLNNLSKETKTQDVFDELLLTTHGFILKVSHLIGDEGLSEDYVSRNGVPWGNSATEVFKRGQCLTGFGAALGRLKDVGAINSFADVREMINGMKIESSPSEFLELFNDKMLDLKNRSKKIGNSQRLFFAYYFRELLNREADNFQSLDMAIEVAYRKFESQTF